MFADATLIIPQFGHVSLTQECVRTLREQDEVRWPICIVDDGSPAAENRSLVERDADFAVQLLPGAHRGLTAAWNRGARGARTPWLIFLNNDTVSTGPWVQTLLAPLRSGAARLAGPRLRTERELPAEVLRKLGTARFLEGWCFAVSAADFAAVGGFDETLALYWSDTDFQARILELAGTGAGEFCSAEAVLATPPAGVALPIRHLGHRTIRAAFLPEDQRRQWQRDRAAFLAKWSAR